MDRGALVERDAGAGRGAADRLDEAGERAPLRAVDVDEPGHEPEAAVTVRSSRSSAASSGHTATPSLRQPPTTAGSAATAAPAEKPAYGRPPSASQSRTCAATGASAAA